MEYRTLGRIGLRVSEIGLGGEWFNGLTAEELLMNALYDAPVDDDAKAVPFGEAEPGATGLELLLSLTLKWAAEDRVPLVDALARVTSAPAAVLGVPSGSVAPGSAADLCVFDPAGWWRVERRSLASQGRNTPFLGHELPGRVRWTLVDGQVVHEA